MTLTEAKDSVAKNYIARYGENNEAIPYSNWKEFEENCMAGIRAGLAPTRLFTALNEAAEFYANTKVKNVSSNSCVSGSLPTEAEIEEHFYVNEDRMSDGDKERLLKQEGAKWLLNQIQVGNDR